MKFRLTVLTSNCPCGFSLVATISVMTLLIMVTLAMLTLSAIEVRQERGSFHQEVARANARLALMIAVGELQKSVGPDQRVTARAAILEKPDQSSLLANRNWLGVWGTTCDSGGKSWPLVGKVSSGKISGSPYSMTGAYTDLRNSLVGLKDGKWRENQLQAWLVSRGAVSWGVDTELDTSRGDVIEILGKGTLGEKISVNDYRKHRVRVGKVNVGNHGAYAWYVSDNNQKASIDPLSSVRGKNVSAVFESAPRANPALVKGAGGREPYENFTRNSQNYPGKMVTYSTAPLTQTKRGVVREALRGHYHHLTSYSPGLFVDTLVGGLRRDLTPVLLSDKGKPSVNFLMNKKSGVEAFSSSYPIIPGKEHGVLGPSFGALRNWALHTYTGLSKAETTFPSSGIRMRPTEHWPHGISDGACFDATQWAEDIPKIHPVMTEIRWHYYFSHHNKRIRTHIIPRVCLWNPYNRDLKTEDMTVMLPNPFYNLTHGMHFFVEGAHVDELLIKHVKDAAHPLHQWVKRGGYAGGNVYKMRVNPFPPARYLAFVLEGANLAAGECHVFSPKVTKATLSSSGVRLQKYRMNNIIANVLSSSSPQGVDHFFYDHAGSVRYQISTKSTAWTDVTSHLGDIDFGRIFDYQPEVVMQSDGKVESFPFVLKAGVAASLVNLYSSTAHPTLQLINNGAGGVKPTTYFGYDGDKWGSALQQDNSFGNLQTFSEAPLKDAPDTHQVGAKLLWFDESSTEANNPPLRVGRWTSDHMALNTSPIANWNVRAQLVTRSPVSQCALKWYMTSTGPWLLQFAPFSPQDMNDQPSLSESGNAFVKNPFGATIAFPFSHRVILFDLPSKDYGVLSIAALRHAMLSPYSWNPSYIIGHSLRDLHAPAEASAHDVAVSPYAQGFPPTRWDYLIGGAKGSGLKHGPYAKRVDSQGLLQIGGQATIRNVAGKSFSSEDEVLAYDVAYEVNHNLWDAFFISGMPLGGNTSIFAWDPGGGNTLWNSRYQFNPDSGMSRQDVIKLVSEEGGLNSGFWRNAEFLKNKAAFNVNSTSVEAWTAFLSGMLGFKRPLASGALGDDVISFARHRRPADAGKVEDADPDKAGAWVGARVLGEDEVRALAENIVFEVRERGPFISVADFVNRRLASDQDENSRMGTVAAAIAASRLNSRFEKEKKYRTTSVVVGSRPGASDNNLTDFKESYRYQSHGKYVTSQPVSQAWGLPGFLIQSDVLEPLAPSLAVRGDTFTIRAYGESSVDGKIKARAWIEAVVERSPRYVDAGNDATDVPLKLDYASGEYIKGGLNKVNSQFGRRLEVKSMRWLNHQEI